MVLLLMRLYSSSDSDPPSDIDWVIWSFAQALGPSSDWELFEERTGDERAPWLRRLPRPSAGIVVVVTSKLEKQTTLWSRPYFALSGLSGLSGRVHCHELILKVFPATSPPVPSSFHSTIRSTLSSLSCSVASIVRFWQGQTTQAFPLL